MKNRAGTPADAASEDQDVHSITDANTSLTDDMHARMVKYSIAMGIRLVCFGMLFVLDGWLKLVAIAGAVFLPWVAVVIANGGSDTVNEHSGALLDNAPLAELPAAEERYGTAGDDGGTVLEGEIIPETEQGNTSDRGGIDGGDDDGGNIDGGTSDGGRPEDPDA
ncbi:MAG: DUF3099 domain-containing protein [Actinomycetales bacterium]|jgi:hypothetical protein